MSGIFTGAGVGPGAPELMTLKAVRAIEECSVIAIPVSDSTLEAPVYETAGSEDGRNEALSGAVRGLSDRGPGHRLRRQKKTGSISRCR